MKTKGVLVSIAAVVGIGVLALVITLFVNPSGNRFGDPDELHRIQSSTDCVELRHIADDVLTPQDGAAADRAVGYANAASDRMKELGC